MALNQCTQNSEYKELTNEEKIDFMEKIKKMDSKTLTRSKLDFVLRYVGDILPSSISFMILQYYRPSFDNIDVRADYRLIYMYNLFLEKGYHCPKRIQDKTKTVCSICQRICKQDGVCYGCQCYLFKYGKITCRSPSCIKVATIRCDTCSYDINCCTLYCDKHFITHITLF